MDDGGSRAPWRVLAEQFTILEPTLKQRILDIANKPHLFSKERALLTHKHTDDIIPGCWPMAKNILRLDPVLSELRYRLVPSKLSEESFWRCYFWNVALIKVELCNDFVTANKTRQEYLTASRNSAETDAARAVGGTEASSTTALDFPFDLAELDAEFESLVNDG